jgi:GTPase Era involved in 16S rRNA processing
MYSDSDEVGYQYNSYELWIEFRKKIYKEVEEKNVKLHEKKLYEFIKKQKNEIENIIEIIHSKAGIEQSSITKKHLKKIEELIYKLDELEKSMTRPLSIFVIGMGKVGKSSLLNALIGDKVAKIDSLPKTWKTDIFWKSTNKDVNIIHRNGKTKKFNHQEAEEIINKEELKREASEDFIESLFQEKKSSNMSKDELNLLKIELTKANLYHSDILKVEWPIVTKNPNSILNKFSLVDTPGLFQNNNGESKENISDFYHQADGILWVFDSTTLSANKPKELLQQLEESLNKSNIKECNNIIAIMNRIDRVRENGGQHMVDAVIEKAHEIFQDKFIDIIPFSAKEALAADKLTSYHEKLLTAIDTFFYKNQLKLKIEGKYSNFKALILTEKDKYDEFLYELKNKNQDREKRKKELEFEKKNIEEILYNDVDSLIKNTIEGVRTRTYQNISEYYRKTANDRFLFFKEKIFDTHYINKKINEDFKEVKIQIGNFVELYKEKSTFSEYKYIKENKSSTPITLKIDDHDLIYYYDISPPPVDSIPNAIKWVARLISDDFRKNELAQSLIDSSSYTLSNIGESLKSSIKNEISNATHSIHNYRESTFSNLYGDSCNVDHLINVSIQLDNIANKKFTQVTFVETLLNRNNYELSNKYQ